MKFDINLYDEDYIAFNVCVEESQKSNYVTDFILTNLLKLGLVSFILVIISILAEINHRILIFICCIILLNIFFFHSKKKYHHATENNKKAELEIYKKYGKVYEENFTVEFLEQELTVHNHHLSMRYPYADISRILSDEQHIFLRLDFFNPIILPVRCLNGQEKELVDFLSTKVAKNLYQFPKF